MFSNPIVIIALLVGLVLFLAVLFWAVEKLVKGEFRIKVKSKTESTPKPIVENVPVQASEPFKQEIKFEPTEKIVEPLNEKNYTIKEHSNRNRHRINDYHADKWKSRNRANQDDFYNTDDDEIKFTEDDMKKLVALRDLFDNK